MFLVEIITTALEFITQGMSYLTLLGLALELFLNKFRSISFFFLFILYRLERHDMFDMIPILFDSTLMIARPTPLDMDFGLLIRPYRSEAWVMVGVTVAVIFAFLILPGFLVPNFSTYTR